jgi:D-inositol-3-phosphate glycosyltransferase
LAKEQLAELTGEWGAAVGEHLLALERCSEGVELLHANYWLSASAAHVLKHVLGLPLVTTFHSLGKLKAHGDGDGPEMGRQEAEQEAVTCSDLVLACSTAEAEALVRLYGADSSRVAVAPPGVRRSLFSPGDRASARRALGLPARAAVVVFAGRIQPLKGLTVAVSSFAQLAQAGAAGRAPSWCRRAGAGRRSSSGALLVVVGGPSGALGEQELADAKQLVELHGLSHRVRWVPPVPHEVLRDYYRSADVCVVPSWSESFGMVALEASSCGAPVVASAVGGLVELVDHGRTGYLAAPGDADAFAHYMQMLLDDPALASSMGWAASEAAKAYTWEATAERFAMRTSTLVGGELVACG